MIRKVLILAIFALFIHQASAESGTLLIDIGATNSYTFTIQYSENPVTTNFLFDYADYNKVSDWQYTPTGWTYPKQADSTTFTIITGGSGFGTVSYQKDLNRINWYCNDYCNITSSPFMVSYSSNIFNGFTYGGDRDKTVSSTEPIFMQGITTGKASSGAYVVNTHKTVQNNYNITYSGTIFNTSIDKSGATVQTKIYIDNATMNRFKENAFTTTSFSYVLPYDSGIILRMQTSDNYWSNVTVNSTGLTTPLPDYGIGGSQNGQMNFDTLQPYIKGYFGINVSMNSTVFDPNKRYFIDVFEPSGKEKVGFPIEISSATYTTGRSWVFSDLGLWNATLTNCNQFNFLCGATGFSGQPPSYQQLIDCINNPLCGTRSNLVDIAVQVINTSSYTYNISSDASVYATNDTIYFNITSTNPSGAYFTILDSLGNVVNPLANNVLIGMGSTYYNITIPDSIQNGNYTAILALNNGYYAQVKSYNFVIGIVPGRDSISWDTNNIFGYTNTLSYSNGNQLNYITVAKTINQSLVITDNFTVGILNQSKKPYLMDAVGLWSATLHNTSAGGIDKHANISVFASSVGLCNTKLDDFVCFNNQSYYAGDQYTINYQMNTISNCLLSGPCIDPYSKILIKVTNPNGITVFNKTIADCSGSVVSCYVNKPLIGSLKSMFKLTDIPGTYQVKLIYTHKDRQIGSNEYIDDVIASNTAIIVTKPLPTTTAPSGNQANTAMQGNLNSFMAQPAFWGVIIWFALVVISASAGTKNAMGNTGVVALVAALLLAIVGLMDPYRWFVLGGVIVIAGIYFMVGRKITSGDT